MLGNTCSARAITSTKLNANNQTIFGRSNLSFPNVETVGSNIFPFPINYSVPSKKQYDTRNYQIFLQTDRGLGAVPHNAIAPNAKHKGVDAHKHIHESKR